MAGFSEEDIRRVREANDLVELFSERTVMRQRGGSFWCCCPFHQEKTPSCKVDASTQLWHCFGCGEGGDIIDYVRKMDDLNFVEAVRFLARRAGIELQETDETRRSHSKKARLKEVCALTAQFYHNQLMRGRSESAAAARAYLSQRNLGGQVPKEWNLGFAPGRGELVRTLRARGYTDIEMLEANVAVRRGNMLSDRFYERVMFPINDARGDCIAFGGRVIGTGEPKYLNSGDTPIFHKSDVLFALDKAKAKMAATGVAIVCEGYTDVIALHGAGFTNAVATLGTSLTRSHIRILSHHAKSKIVYVFDGDEAGQRAADRALQFIDSSITPEAGNLKVDLCAVTLPDNLDPADFVSQHGGQAFQECLDGAVPLIRYGIDRRLAKFDLSTPEGRSRAGVQALSLLAPIKDSLLAKDYAVYIASRTHQREGDLLERLAQLKPPRTYDAPAPAQGASSAAETNGAAATAPRAVASFEMDAGARNRLRSEREFLALLANNPAMASEFYTTLAQTSWHDRVHAELAAALMDILGTDEGLSVADVVSRAQERCRYATKVLTAAVNQGFGSAHDSLSYLADDLVIGDLESTVASLREDLRRADSLPQDEKDAYFQSVLALQSQLNALRARHTGQS